MMSSQKNPKKVVAPSTKEKDQKDCSTKKVKMGVGNLYSMKMSFSNANGAPSYKDTIAGIRPTTVGPTTEESMTADEIINVVIEEICPTPFMDDNEIEKVKPINPFPEIEVNVEQYERWCGYWKHPLLVKLMGKKVNLNFISARLQKLWACIGTVQVLDLNHDFFLFRFSHEDDYNFVFYKGP